MKDFKILCAHYSKWEMLPNYCKHVVIACLMWTEKMDSSLSTFLVQQLNCRRTHEALDHFAIPPTMDLLNATIKLQCQVH